MLKQLLAGAAAVAMVATVAFARQDEKSSSMLKPGDPAPKLTEVTWVKGEPVSEYKPGQIYVLDFWATWCGPCKAAIPHMNDLHNEHKKDGVNVIGVAIWPRPNMVPTKEFVDQKGDAMAYRIAEDKEGGATAKAFMEAAGQNGIPTVMIVDRAGKLAWLGHPMGGMDEALKGVIAGTWNVEEARKKFNDEAERSAKSGAINRKLRAAMKEKDWASFITLADEALKSDPETFGGLAFHKYRILLVEVGDSKAAGAWGREVVNGEMGSNAQMMNQFAWFICADKTIKDEERDADLALNAATKAAEKSEHKDAAILDTLAHAHFLKGNYAEAISTSRKAIELANDPEMKADLEKSLEKFEKAASKS